MAANDYMLHRVNSSWSERANWKSMDLWRARHGTKDERRKIKEEL